MPQIQITMLKGRTTEQKRKIVQRLTDAMVEEAKTSRDAVVVTIIEVGAKITPAAVCSWRTGSNP